MFDTLSKKFQNLFSSFAKGKKISDSNIEEAIKEVRFALLEADVNYSVVSHFVQKVKEKAIGQEVIKSVSPKEQFIKIVHDELIDLMGKDEAKLNLSNKPAVIMLCGLQGSGKTTTSVKIAHFLKNKHKRVLLAALDLQRPAAIEQLKKLASDAKVDVFSSQDEKKVKNVAKLAHKKAIDEKYDVLIIDTAGRLHIDEVLMDELADIKKITNPDEVLYVANATFGQDAVKTALEFDKKVSITGSILTMLDSDARAGAAISIKEVTNKPLKFEATGEKIEDFQIFNPNSMADRILGMGDVINLVRKAKEVVDEVNEVHEKMEEESHIPNKETVEAIKEAEDGGGKTFETVDELIEELESDIDTLIVNDKIQWLLKSSSDMYNFFYKQKRIFLDICIYQAGGQIEYTRWTKELEEAE
ncbi:MAG: Signal recognition particle protein, partial [Candidatus Anoxychlamydiales bacterium]|nr:Signal recognition particle protein [Candidatus Anoxychlamydiales bacterium]